MKNLIKRRKPISKIVASITKMRQELLQAVEESKEDIRGFKDNKIQAKEAHDKAVEDAGKRLEVANKIEDQKIESAEDEIDSANEWLAALPNVSK